MRQYFCRNFSNFRFLYQHVFSRVHLMLPVDEVTKEIYTKRVAKNAIYNLQ